MAGTDHGEVLTKFEEIFGSVVEHEVIKLILQSCDWNATYASDTLLAMIDKNDLPPHVLSALTAESIVRNCFAGTVVSSHPGSVVEEFHTDSLDAVSPEASNNWEFHPSPSETDQVGYLEKAQVQWAFAPEFVPSAPRNPIGLGVWPQELNSSSNGMAKYSPQSPRKKHKAKSRVGKKKEVANKILNGTKLMVILRGLPGSGKTTLAKELRSQTGRGVILSTDDFFCNKRGNYVYDPTRIGEAHEWNKRRALKKLKEGKTPIFIDNTNLQLWEMKPYVKFALQFGYEVEVLEADTPWRLHPKELARKCVHGVPKAKIQEMKQRYQLGINIVTLISELQGQQASNQEGEYVNETQNNVLAGRDVEDFHEEWTGAVIESVDLNMEVPNDSQHECNGMTSSEGESGVTISDDLSRALSQIKLSCSNDDIESSDLNDDWMYDYADDDQLSDGGDDDDDADVIVEGYEEERTFDSFREGVVNEAIILYASKESDDILEEVCNELEEKYVSAYNLKEQKNTDVKVIDNVECMDSTHLGTMNTTDHKVINNSKDDSVYPDLKDVAQLEKQTSAMLQLEELGQPSTSDQTNPIAICSASKAVESEQGIERIVEETNDVMNTSETETEWDNLTTEVEQGEVTDEKFNDMVACLGSALKLQVQGKRASKYASVEEVDSRHVTVVPDTINEDSVMYELCRNIEEKTGMSFSKLVARTDETEQVLPAVDQDLNSQSLDRSAFSVLNIPGAQPGLIFGNEMNEAVEETSSALNCEDENGDTSTMGFKQKIIHEDNVCADSHVDNCTDLIQDISKPGTDTFLPEECSMDDKVKVTHMDMEVHNLAVMHKHPMENDTATDCLTTENTHDHKQMKSGSNVSGQSIAKPDKAPLTDSLSSWECVDINDGVSSISWEAPSTLENRNYDSGSPKPTRARRQRTSGDPLKWLTAEKETSKDEEDPIVASWNPLPSGISPSWDAQTSVTGAGEASVTLDEPQPHTGAVSKYRRQKKHTFNSGTTGEATEPSQDNINQTSFHKDLIETNSRVISSGVLLNVETQTLSIDFEALQLDNNLYELKVIYGKPNYKPMHTGDLKLDDGPLTKGKLRLEKGTMTESIDDVTTIKPFWNLVAFFPSIPEEDLRDVFEKCKFDLDWAMNVLLDGGYEMSDPSEVNVKNAEMNDKDQLESEPTSETASSGAGDGRYDQSFADASDTSSDMVVEEKAYRIKQSQQPRDLAAKKEIEQSFNLSDSVDDRVTRLTGKDAVELNMTKVKKTKNKKKVVKKSISSKNVISEENSEAEEGAQYITLVMDPLFASQLCRMFGPVGSYEFGGELSPEDRSVILPLEFCHTIHQFWNLTLDDKFRHEAKILDSLIREDECLARRLQEEENANTNTDSTVSYSADESFLRDPPTQLQEIMDLEQAIQQSQGEQGSTGGEPSISSRLNLQRLYAEYPHVDRAALKEEFGRSGHNYQLTVENLTQRYGAEQGTPKTVMAPEALYRYEKQMIDQAQRNSLIQQEEENASQHTRDLIPDDPQVFRDEAQLHYYQRQEAYKKAQDASRQGMKAVAAYYARIGNLHAAKLTEANKRASEKILEVTNASRCDANCLDLHLLHVPEAISATQAFLSERQRVLVARGMKQMQVSLITGRGAHSLGGQAKLKPAIKDFLQRSGYLFHEANLGMFTVTLQM